MATNYNKWNTNWDEDFVRTDIPGYQKIDDEPMDDFKIVHYDIPQKKCPDEHLVEKQPVFKTEGKISVTRDPYNHHEYIYTKKVFEFKPGVTVLVGCNGSGKTTLLRMMKEQLKNKKIPVVSFDNLHDGGSNARSLAMYENNFEFLSTAACSSEGENIIMNIGRVASTLRQFIKTGESQDKSDKLAKAFAQAVWGDEKEEVPNERWILFDAIDSGLSVDNVIDIKEYLFKTILNDADGCDIYIIVSANEYEMCREENCLDVSTGKYIQFDGYEEYRGFVIQSRKKKDKRYGLDEKGK